MNEVAVNSAQREATNNDNKYLDTVIKSKRKLPEIPRTAIDSESLVPTSKTDEEVLPDTDLQGTWIGDLDEWMLKS